MCTTVDLYYISHYFYRRPSVFKYESLLQSSHFGTLNNLGKYIYFAFALRKQLTNDNWKIQPHLVVEVTSRGWSHISWLKSHLVVEVTSRGGSHISWCIHYVCTKTVSCHLSISVSTVDIYLNISSNSNEIHDLTESVKRFTNIDTLSFFHCCMLVCYQ